jgi:hypothetical protein
MVVHDGRGQGLGKFKDYEGLFFLWKIYFHPIYFEQVTLADETSASPPVIRIIKSPISKVDSDEIRQHL